MDILPQSCPHFTQAPSPVLVFVQNKQRCDVIGNRTEDPGKGNGRFSSEPDMIFNESDQELRDLAHQKHAFLCLRVTTRAAIEICQTQGM